MDHTHFIEQNLIKSKQRKNHHNYVWSYFDPPKYKEVQYACQISEAAWENFDKTTRNLVQTAWSVY